MEEKFTFYLILAVLITLLIILAKKIRIAYPILLVLAGLAVSFIPSVPIITIDPQLIFIIFLPPLLYESAWNISWKELWKWRRIISSFAFLVVFFTAFAVGVTAWYFIPGFTLALGLLLGGIVSPPDAVSVGAILKNVKIPKSSAAILEGESLLNDASSLIIFHFAIAAIMTGHFVWYEALGSFLWMVIGGVGIGILIGKIFMEVHKKLETDVNIDTILTLIAPYIMYLAAEETHASGVLSVVSGGLFLSYNQHKFLSSSSRLRAISVWNCLGFILNGTVFMMIGLDLPQIIAELENVSISKAIGYGVLVTGVVILVRFISSYAAVIATFIARKFTTVAAAQNHGWQFPVFFGWSGMRGVVSLAAALSIPVYMDNGQLFPERSLILFVTFVVILLTLVVQGLTLPYLIKKLKLPADENEMSEEHISANLFKEMTAETLHYLQEKYGDKIQDYPHVMKMVAKWEKKYNDVENVCRTIPSKNLYIDLLEFQRRWLLKKNSESKDLDEDVIKKHLMRLDLEEERLKYSSF